MNTFTANYNVKAELEDATHGPSTAITDISVCIQIASLLLLLLLHFLLNIIVHCYQVGLGVES